MGFQRKTVSNLVAWRIMQTAEQCGISPREFRVRTGLNLEQLSRIGGRIDYAHHAKVMELASGLTLPPGLTRVSILDNMTRDYPALYGLVANSPSLRDAINAYLEFRGLVGQLDSIEMHEEDGLLYVVYRPESSWKLCTAAPVANFMVLASISQLYPAERPSVVRSVLCSPKSTQTSQLAALLDCKVDFGEHENILVFDSRQIDHPLPDFNARLHGVFENAARVQIAEIDSVSTFAQLVSAEIRRLFSAGFEMDRSNLIQECSRVLMLHPSALQRRLRSEGKTFSEVELTAKYELAKQLLGDARTPIIAVSERLGFRYQSSFSRFFKDCCGLPPNEFRECLRH